MSELSSGTQNLYLNQFVYSFYVCLALVENGVVISSPLDTTELLHPGAAYNEKKSLAAEEAGQSAVARQHKLTLSPEKPFKVGLSFMCPEPKCYFLSYSFACATIGHQQML